MSAFGILLSLADKANSISTSGTSLTVPEFYTQNDGYFNKEFQVQNVGKIELCLKGGGSINIEGWDKNLVSIEVYFKGPDADNLEFEFSQDGNDVTIESYTKERRTNNITVTTVDIKMPRLNCVDFTTFGGAVNIKNTEGEIEGITWGGDIEINQAMNGVDVKTKGGTIKISKAVKFVKAETMGGNIDVEMVGGSDETNRDIFLKSQGGEIFLTVHEHFSMDAEVKIGFTKQREGVVDIISDVAFERKMTDKWEKTHLGAVLKYLTGKTSVNGGINEVEIETVNENVYLKYR